MDVFLKVTLDDLKFSFQKILGMDFFSKKFEYYLLKEPNTRLDKPLDSSIQLEEDASIKEYLNDPTKEVSSSSSSSHLPSSNRLMAHHSPLINIASV